MTAAYQSLTLEQFLKLPETKPASEYQDGRITQKPVPKGKHSRLQLKWAAKLGLVTEENRQGMAFPELRCTFAGRSMVPDVAYFVWDRIPRDDQGLVDDEFTLAPDISIEILSPKQDPEQLSEKLSFCVSNDGRLGLLVDPDAEAVTVFRPARAVEVLQHGPISLEPVIEGAAVTVEEVFGWLK